MRALTCIYGSRGGAGGIKPEPWNPLPETLSEALNSSATVILEPVDKLIAGPQDGSCAGVCEVPGAVSSGAGVWE